jgi:hypothetical protein
MSACLWCVFCSHDWYICCLWLDVRRWVPQHCTDTELCDLSAGIFTDNLGSKDQTDYEQRWYQRVSCCWLLFCCLVWDAEQFSSIRTAVCDCGMLCYVRYTQKKQITVQSTNNVMSKLMWKYKFNGNKTWSLCAAVTLVFTFFCTRPTLGRARHICLPVQR